MKFEPREKGIPNLLKLKSGESVKGVLRGIPYKFRQHWVHGRSALCEGGDCSYCKEKDDKGKPNYPGFRFRVNFVISENGQWIAKVFEQGGRVYDKFEALGSEYDLDKTILKITRYGTDAQSTNYEIVPIPKGDITPSMEKELTKIKLNDLTHAQTREPGADEEDDDIPL